MRELLFAAALLLPTAALGQEFTGWYAGFELSDGTATEQMIDGNGWPNKFYRLAAPTAGGFVGLNVDHGSLIYGAELRMRFDTKTSQIHEWVNPNDPQNHGHGKVREVFSPSLNFRLGQQFGNVLAYARAGFGLTKADIEYSTTIDYHWTDISKYSWVSPTANVGAGIEVHGDTLFVRAEGDIRYTRWKRDEFGEMQYRASIGVGLKFH